MRTPGFELYDLYTAQFPGMVPWCELPFPDRDRWESIALVVDDREAAERTMLQHENATLAEQVADLQQEIKILERDDG